MTPRTVPRAPTQDGAIVAAPPLAEIASVIDANRRRLHRTDLELLGRPLVDLQQVARREAVQMARAYLTRIGEPLPVGVDGPGPLLLAGHQPELFHPGVWVKNFALNGLARAHGLIPLNLIVDNDVAHAASLRLPAPADADHPWPYSVSVPFDHWTGEAPYEEQQIRDPELFADFPERVEGVYRGWGLRPLLTRFWPDVCSAAKRGLNAGESFAAARRALERAWGCHNLEVPLSALCRGDGFAWFACHLLSELPRFHTLYNDTVRAYRRRHGLRSRNHPVPDLTSQDDWLEAPFWGWRPGQVRRGRLFARLEGEHIALRAGDDAWPTLPRGDPEGWHLLERAGCKARSRALTTTLFSRLFLADLFIHGIGGGKYDELTDELLQGFYGVTVPGFLILTATKLLPLPTFPATQGELRRLTHAERDLLWNPQRHLPADEARERVDLVAERQRLVAWEPTDRAGRRLRFARLREVTARLGEGLGEQAAGMHERRERVSQEVTANALLRRRDYSFCLHPEETLRPFCRRFLNV